MAVPKSTVTLDQCVRIRNAPCELIEVIMGRIYHVGNVIVLPQNACWVVCMRLMKRRVATDGGNGRRTGNACHVVVEIVRVATAGC